MARAPLSITARLALLFSAVAVVVFAAVGAYLYRTLAQQMTMRDDLELIGKVALIRHIVGEAPSLQALADAPHPLLDVAFGHDGLRLHLLGPDGRVVVQNTPSSDPLPPGPDVPAARVPDMDDVRSWRPAAGNGRMLSAMGTAGDGAAVRIIVARERSDRLSMLRGYATDLLVAVGIGAMLATVLGFVIVRRGMRPLRAVIGKANDISTHRLNSRLSVRDAPAELQELGMAFNAMLDRLEDGVQRLSGFAADLAHDLRTPVNTLMVETQVALARSRSNEEYQALLASNIEEYERLARMIENTLFLARVDNAQMGLQLETLDASAELQRIGEYFEGLADDAGVALTVDAADVTLQADAILLQRAVSNLVSNAIRHTPHGGTVRLTARSGASDVQIAIVNSGPGIAPEHLPRIFDRFYRADPARSASAESSGLGLAIVRAIMALHGGAIEAHSTPGESTTFLLRFPPGATPARAASAP